MAKNRLHLAWELETSEERSEFVQQYIQKIENPTSDELETIANYILWGKEKDGPSVVEDGYIELETKNKTWTRTPPESLEALMESPTFNELAFQPLETPRTKVPRQVFSREEALERSTGILRESFLDLFHRIDSLDYQIAYYEFTHNKRRNPPRESLVARLAQDELLRLERNADSWNQWAYLKRRHLLVELRREQYTLRDSYAPQILTSPSLEPAEVEPPPVFEVEYPVFPVGLFNDTPEAAAIFRPRGELWPGNFTQSELKSLSDLLWKKKREFDENPPKFFDFRNLEHVYQFFQKLQELEDLNVDPNTNFLIRTLNFYISEAEISEAQHLILDMKIQKFRNYDIADAVNAKFGKTYTANYISTIFRQKIIPRINEAAQTHLRVLENLFFEEEFKRCTYCGKWLLIGPEYFVRKARARDGFAARCKKCDKAVRDSKKGGKVDGN